MLKNLFAFAVIMITLLFVCNACMNSFDSSTGSSSTSSSYSSSSSSYHPVNIPNWQSHAYITDLEKEKRAYVESKVVISDHEMDFPYKNTTARINVVKNNQSTWAYIEFSSSPNIVGSEIQDGYNVIKANVYIDDVRETATLTQEWGSKTLHFRYPVWLIGKLKNCETFRINLRWHGNSNAVWSFSGNGFTSEYESMQLQFKNL